MSPELRSSYTTCREIARREARNFYSAFRLLPTDRRLAMCALYAFMRHTDDLADNVRTAEERRHDLDAWREDLASALVGGNPQWPGLRALADTRARYQIPLRHFHEAINGVLMDVESRTFSTFEELSDYCYHVASVVGLCCIHIWGFSSDGGRAERLAESCGIALQLTNILRDVREDACNGRIYLPRDDMARFGVAPEELRAESPSEGLRALLAFEAERANSYYREAEGLAPLVSPVGRPVLLTIVGIYRALLDEIIRHDYDVLGRRIKVPTWRKMAIAFRSLPRRFFKSGAPTATMSAP